ncbi:glycine betaine ABC transporter substrate-binding protein [Arthrobacter sp. Cr_A7]|uniref:glycine betaine ABC transporter substrate-binding protein n=1 Tax=Arthrobacter sp. Cr_A7 TaxID=3031017 RepID=UPI0023DA7035|nr:glycine betaine ABC transporter substrate-binding protein [Arthrobacter sp. Cr_A7]MDF2051652.1 glycine betaine ABC transporter substrate-binding protein [Arthrobacter sp. Cr_A7]
MKNLLKTTLAAAAIVVSVSACSGVAPGGAAGGDSDKTLTFANVPGYDDTVAINALWSVLLEEKGYNVETTNVDLAAGFSGIARGDLDGYLNAWLPSTHATYVDKYKDDLVVLEDSFFENNRLVLAVPESVSENSISEVAQNAEKYESKIIGIEAGSGLMKLLPDVMAKYSAQNKLKIVEGSTPAALAALENGVNSNKPVVVALWEPHWAFASMPIKSLEDDLQGWPKPDSSYPVLSKEFAEKHADVVGWLSKSQLTEEQFASLMLSISEAKDPTEGVQKWLETPENRTAADEWLK